MAGFVFGVKLFHSRLRRLLLMKIALAKAPPHPALLPLNGGARALNQNLPLPSPL